MGNAFRNQPSSSAYHTYKTPVREDGLQIGTIFAFGIVWISFLLILPGIRGWERLWAAVRVFIALWIGAVLLICNYGSWYSDSICTSTQFKAHAPINTPQIIQATVAISITLRGFNVTLREEEDGCGSEDYIKPFPRERIFYVEQFLWAPSFRQGRQDFGKFGGHLRQQYREAKYRGMPYPITWVAENFLFDGDQYIWYRKFRIAGWYTHMWMWLGVATYLLSIMYFIVSIRYGAFYMLLTGLVFLLSALTYGVVIQNDPPLRIYFPDAVLRPYFNYSFYLAIGTGTLTCLIALLILLIDYIAPRTSARIFHHSSIEDDEVFEEVDEEGAQEHQGRNDMVTGRQNTLAHNMRESIRSIQLGKRNDQEERIILEEVELEEHRERERSSQEEIPRKKFRYKSAISRASRGKFSRKSTIPKCPMEVRGRNARHKSTIPRASRSVQESNSGLKSKTTHPEDIVKKKFERKNTLPAPVGSDYHNSFRRKFRRKSTIPRSPRPVRYVLDESFEVVTQEESTCLPPPLPELEENKDENRFDVQLAVMSVDHNAAVEV